jgi:DNA modification methylase
MLDILEVIEPETIDSVVTDPPYELNFMGKGWDNSGIAFQKETWRKCYEVLKPGGYLLAFGGSRTFHRIACAIEDAGFEIRDTIMWLYGSGFPKSMDISKSLDKKNKNTKEEYIKFGNYLKEKREENKISKIDLGKKLFNFDSNREDVPIQSWEIGKEIPTKDFYLKLKEILKLNDTFDWLIEREEAEREIIGKKEYTNDKNIMNISNYNGERVHLDITTPATDLAKQYEGWGTALKPSFEPIIVARKPFKGSLVDNVIENGVGGINIDECRIGNETTITKRNGNSGSNGVYGKDDRKFERKNPTGRFPANTILTYDGTDFDEVCGGFPNTKSQVRISEDKDIKQNTFSLGRTGITPRGHNDSGSASRYFYCAKASKKDRDEGLDSFNIKGAKELLNREENSDGASWNGKYSSGNAFAGCGAPKKNTHPTVKPTELMQYLVRLVNPNGATILDPFNGSGSTGKAVMYENRERNKNYKYIGIELTEEYLPIAKARIEYAMGVELNKGKIQEEAKEEGQTTIFDFIGE